MRREILILALLLLAMPAAAASKFGACGVTDIANAVDDASFLKVGPNDASCFYFTAAENSAVINVLAPTALFFFAPDAEADAAGNAAVMIQKCQAGVTVYDANRCFNILDNALDGTVGGSNTQLIAVRVARGLYAIRNSVTAAGDFAIVSIEAE